MSCCGLRLNGSVPLLEILLLSRPVGGVFGGMEIHRESLVRFAPEYAWNITEKSERDLERIDILQTKYDVVFLNDLSCMAYLPSLRRRMPRAIYVLRSGGNDILRAPIDNDESPIEIRQRKISRLINEYIDYLIVNSDYSYFRNLMVGISAVKMVKVRGGVDLLLLGGLHRDRIENRSKFDEKYQTQGKHIVVILSRMAEFKGTELFLKAMLRYWDERSFLLIIGGGECSLEIKTILERNFHPKSYLMTGQLSHAKAMEYLSIADVCVSSAIEQRRKIAGGTYVHTETMGRTLMEAATLGVKIVATDVGGVFEIFAECPDAGELVNCMDDCARLACSEHKDVVKRCFNEEYGWNSVFDVYRSIFWRLGTVSYVFDIDGTLLTDGVDAKEVANFLRNHKGVSHYVFNSARGRDPETVRWAVLCGVDDLILGNGTIVIHNGIVNSAWERYVEREVKGDDFLKGLYDKLVSVMPVEGVSLTHPNTLVIRKRYVTEHGEDELDKICKGGQYSVLETKEVYKVVHKVCNKKGAMQFVLKNRISCRTIGIGDGINDVSFCQACDCAYLAAELRHCIRECDLLRMRFFARDEIGLPLLKRVFSEN